MAPLPVINDVFRIDIPWGQSGGTLTHNTFHIRTTMSNLDDIGLRLGVAFDAGGDNQWLYRPTAGGTSEVEITPLDGTTARQVVSLDTTIHGSGDGEAIPAAAGLVSFRSEQRGAQGRGRLYIGPIQESQQSNGIITESITTGVAAGWTAFKEALEEGIPTIELVVASYVHSAAYTVTSMQFPRPLVTQRRRQSRISL